MEPSTKEPTKTFVLLEECHVGMRGKVCKAKQTTCELQATSAHVVNGHGVHIEDYTNLPWGRPMSTPNGLLASLISTVAPVQVVADFFCCRMEVQGFRFRVSVCRFPK